MSDKKELFWISKSSTFGIGKNAIKYGDAINAETIDKKVLAKQIAKGNIGQIKQAVTSGDKKLIEAQRLQIVKLQEQIDSEAPDESDVIKELKDKYDKVLEKALAKKDKEIAKLEKSLKPDSKEVIELLDEKDAEIKKLSDELESAKK
jgi:hypothetical protein